MNALSEGRSPAVLRALDEALVSPELFNSFDRRQEVRRRLVKEKGVWKLEDVEFTENWGVKEIELLTRSLRALLRAGGGVWGAFMAEALVGFVALESGFFGAEFRYLQVSCLHVSHDERGKGIGRKLFQLVCREARKRGAEKLYISAHSALETQDFYRNMGCVEALESDSRLAAAEPYDCQLEFDLADGF